MKLLKDVVVFLLSQKTSSNGLDLDFLALLLVHIQNDSLKRGSTSYNNIKYLDFLNIKKDLKTLCENNTNTFLQTHNSLFLKDKMTKHNLTLEEMNYIKKVLDGIKKEYTK